MQAPAGHVELFELPHVEARRLARSGVPVVLTVNPVEYHGPHLSLHNDRLISRGVARELGARLAARRPAWPCVLGADLEVGVEPCPGPGTRHTDYAATRALVLEACRALAELGASKVVLLTFHGAPLHNLALQAGVDFLRARGVKALAPFHLVLRTLLELDDPWRFGDALGAIGDAREREAMARDLRMDFHAGFFETSLALHYAPASVSPRHVDLPPCPTVVPEVKMAAAARAARRLGRETLARELEFAATGLGWNALRPFPGYTGRPHLASAAAGAAFARHMMAVAEPVVWDVLENGAPPPAPIMTWVGTLSAGGRLGRIPRPAPDEIEAIWRA
jgi:creatinine amidohydrolase